jgi:serine/threonine-protein kinase
VPSNAHAVSAPPALRVVPTVELSDSEGTTLGGPDARSGGPFTTLGRETGQTAEEPVAAQIRFRRALIAGMATYCAFSLVDWGVVYNLNAGRLAYFLALRAAYILFVCCPILWRLYGTPPSRRLLTFFDLAVYSNAAAFIALMCVEFDGIASPYVNGVCLVFLARTITAQDPFRRGLVLNGVPFASFYAVLLGAALFSPRVAAQLHDSAALATLLLNSAYVLSTCMFLVVGGHIMWSLRRQLFEARSLGRYRLKRRIGGGGMGDVWVAYHAGLKRDVAVKVLRVDTQERRAGAVSRFEREVRATSELVHPNTIRVFDYGTTEDGLCYYVMELLEGENLRAHVDRLGPLEPARAIHVIGQAARALGEAHERGIVHRDVKPENLFLTSLGGEHDFVKVIDFGIAKVANVEATMTRTGWVLGTPEYMSPEVAMGKPADPRSDVYALGAVLYFLLCGRPPFLGENAGRLFFAHATETPLPPSFHAGRPLPEDLEAIVMRSLEKEPDARFPSASAFAMALATCTLAGKWTFGDATHKAKHSSRPPPSAGIQALVPPLPRLPALRLEPGDDPDVRRGRTG